MNNETIQRILRNIEKAINTGKCIVVIVRTEDKQIVLDWETQDFPLDDLDAAKCLILEQFEKQRGF